MRKLLRRKIKMAYESSRPNYEGFNGGYSASAGRGSSSGSSYAECPTCGYSGRCSKCGHSEFLGAHIGKYGHGSSGGMSSVAAGIPVISGGY
jgi:hypothetical protein